MGDFLLVKSLDLDLLDMLFGMLSDSENMAQMYNMRHWNQKQEGNPVSRCETARTPVGRNSAGAARVAEFQFLAFLWYEFVAKISKNCEVKPNPQVLVLRRRFHTCNNETLLFNLRLGF